MLSLIGVLTGIALSPRLGELNFQLRTLVTCLRQPGRRAVISTRYLPACIRPLTCMRITVVRPEAIFPTIRPLA